MDQFQYMNGLARTGVLVTLICFLLTGVTMTHAQQNEEFVIEGTDRKPAESAFREEGRADTAPRPEIDELLDKPDVDRSDTAGSLDSILQKDLSIDHAIGADTPVDPNAQLGPSELFMFIVGTGAVLVVL